MPPPKNLPAGTTARRLTSNGAFMLAGVQYRVGGQYGFQDVLTIVDGDTITIVDPQGEILIEHTRPAPEVTYVGTGRPSGPRPRNQPPSPKS